MSTSYVIDILAVDISNDWKDHRLIIQFYDCFIFVEFEQHNWNLYWPSNAYLNTTSPNLQAPPIRSHLWVITLSAQS